MQEARHAEAVLDGRIRRERHGVLVRLRLDAGRIVLARHVQRPDVQHHHAGDHERQQVVQRVEAVERRIADRVAAPQPGDDGVADAGNGREQIGDHGRGPEAHLAPDQHVAHEAGRHHQQIDDDAEDPEHLARLLVGAVIQAAEHVDVDGEEEHRRAVGVQIAQQPAVIDVAHDRFDRLEGEVDMRRVVHRQHDAGDDLHAEHERQDAAEGPPVVQVARRRVGDERGMNQAADRQPLLEPLQRDWLRLVGRGSTRCDRSADLNFGVGNEFVRRQRADSSAPDLCGCGRRCRIASRGRGRTSRHIRPGGRAGCSRDGCRCRSRPATGRGLS